MGEKRCERCGSTLSRDEIALFKKLFNRGAERFWCLDCQASHFCVSRGLLEEKIEEFREYGCTLFL